MRMSVVAGPAVKRDRVGCYRATSPLLRSDFAQSTAGRRRTATSRTVSSPATESRPVAVEGAWRYAPTTFPTLVPFLSCTHGSPGGHVLAVRCPVAVRGSTATRAAGDRRRRRLRRDAGGARRDRRCGRGARALERIARPSAAGAGPGGNMTATAI